MGYQLSHLQSLWTEQYNHTINAMISGEIINNSMDSDMLLMISRLWPIFVAFILLIVTLAQAHYRIKVLEEKVKVAFELINKLTDKFSK